MDIPLAGHPSKTGVRYHNSAWFSWHFQSKNQKHCSNQQPKDLLKHKTTTLSRRDFSQANNALFKFSSLHTAAIYSSVDMYSGKLIGNPLQVFIKQE